MKFLCPHCNNIFVRDMRLKESKILMFKRGYLSRCDTTGKKAYCKPIKEKEWVQHLELI